MPKRIKVFFKSVFVVLGPLAEWYSELHVVIEFRLCKDFFLSLNLFNDAIILAFKYIRATDGSTAVNVRFETIMYQKMYCGFRRNFVGTKI